jgi:hypothetical protein
MARYDVITVRWFEDFGGYHDLVIDLGPEDQSDPRVAAIVELWREKWRAKMASSTGDGEVFR